MIDIDDMRKRNRCAILNTATGKALGKALDEIEELRREKQDLRTALEGDPQLDRIFSNQQVHGQIGLLAIGVIKTLCSQVLGAHPEYPESYPETLKELGKHLSESEEGG